jgi:pimeloyl-ACP methyl ester carboxylesterase
MSSERSVVRETAVVPRTTVATTKPDKIEIEYDTFGSPDDPPLLLVMGFTAQLIAWDPTFCTQFVDRGRYVIRYDNRDCGLSTHLDGQHVDILKVIQARLDGTPLPPSPYNLSDMANDAVGLLDALGIDRAHIVGASMGGMIAQTIAIEHPERCLTMTSIMSTTGDPQAGEPAPEAMAFLMTPPPTDREAYIANAPGARVFTSKRYFDPEKAKERAAASFDRAFYPEGASRQLAAVYTSGDRTEGLGGVTVPSFVLHGRDDTLVPPRGGAMTAEAIPNATYLLLADMGHDLPEPLWPVIVPAITMFQDLAVGTAAASA